MNRLSPAELFRKMRTAIKMVLPKPVFNSLKTIYEPIRNLKYRHFGRPRTKAESSKARSRRENEGFFEKYCSGKGLDVGYGGDLLTGSCKGWDFEHGDAQFLKGVPDARFDFVYSSHTLEHMVDPTAALQNWWRVVKPGGYLIVYIPHRDLYEKKKTLPSRWNTDHKHFFLPDFDEPPDTLGVVPLLERSISNYELIYLKVCDEGHTISDPAVHSDGEYSIEFVLRKKV